MLRRSVLLSVLLTAWLLRMPFTVHADAPSTRGPDTGGTGATGVGASWHDVELLPPLGAVSSGSTTPTSAWGSGSARVPQLAPLRQGQDGGVTGWIDRNLNPGNWLMDAVLGGNTGMMLTGIELMSVVVVPLVDPQSQCLGVVFCTPTDILFGQTGSMSIGLYTVWGRLEGIAVALATIFFILRIGRMITEGPQSLRTDGPGLLLTLLAAVVFIYGSGPVLKLLVDLFNGINDTILQGEDFKILDVFRPSDFNFGIVLIQFGAVITVLIFVIMGYVRLLKLFVLMCFAPLMGALLLTGITAGTFWQWIKAIVGLLLQQTAWSLAFLIGMTIATPSGSMPNPSHNAGTVNEIAGLLIALLLAMMSRKALEQVVQLVPAPAQRRGIGRQLLGYAMVGTNIGRRGGSPIGAAARGAVIGGAPGAAMVGAGAAIGHALGRSRRANSRPHGSAGPDSGNARDTSPPRRGQGQRATNGEHRGHSAGFRHQRQARPTPSQASAGVDARTGPPRSRVVPPVQHQHEREAYAAYRQNYRMGRKEQRRAQGRQLGRAVRERRNAQGASSTRPSDATASKPVLLRRMHGPAHEQRRRAHAALAVRRAEQAQHRSHTQRQHPKGASEQPAPDYQTPDRIDPQMSPLRKDALLYAAGQPRSAPHRRRVALMRREVAKLAARGTAPLGAGEVRHDSRRSTVERRPRRGGYQPVRRSDETFLRALEHVPSAAGNGGSQATHTPLGRPEAGEH